ncbi:putative protein N(5)-glutamine methyltransferase [uncultured Amnibacterium sp.]|uniref:putative protein N(5)-glutamine methyltransferase n=1 Tax=uncultured Amnibacterium sp. TaxID=1631851 RepID=UPI0035CB0833
MDTGALIAELRAAGCVFAEDEAAILIEASGGGTVLDEAMLAEMVRRRVRGEPLEAIVGWADFAGIRVVVEPGVFVPRQRSALLVDLAAGLAPRHGTVLDLCCGTGGIGAAVAFRRPDAAVFGADLDQAAVHCARRNLPAGRVFEGDLFDALPDRLRGALDLVVVNAPYVPTEAIALMPPEARDHEHRIALDGGADGLDLHRRIASDASGWLTPDGVLAIEASERQAPVSAGLFRGNGFAAEVVCDDEIEATAVIVRRTHS